MICSENYCSKYLRDFWQQHADSEQPLKAWFHDVSRMNWQSPTDIKNVYANASILPENRVVFNIKGNDYRLIVHVRYDISIVLFALLELIKSMTKLTQ